MRRKNQKKSNKLFIATVISTIVLIIALISIFFLHWMDDNKPHKYQELLQKIETQVKDEFVNVNYTTDETGSEKVIVYIPTDSEGKALDIPFKTLEKFYNDEHYEELDEVVILKLTLNKQLENYKLYDVVREVYKYDWLDYKLQKREVVSTLFATTDTVFLKNSELFENYLFDDTYIVNAIKQEVTSNVTDEINQIVYLSQIDTKKLNELSLLYTPEGLRIILNNSNGRLSSIQIPIENFIGYLKLELVFDNFKEIYNSRQETILATREVEKSNRLDDLITEIKSNPLNHKIALTFDDGPNPNTTPRALDILKKHNIKATFYILGSSIAGNEALLKRIVAEGHELGNHTWTHPDLVYESDEVIAKEFQDTQNKIFEVTGVYPATFRPPYGSYNKRVYEQIKLPIVLWNVDSNDWSLRNSQKITERVINNTYTGAIILMHDIHETTVNSLDNVISGLKNKNFGFVTLSELYRPGQLTKAGVVYFGQNDAFVVK